MRRNTLGPAVHGRNALPPPARTLPPMDRRSSALPLGGGRRSSVVSSASRPMSSVSRRQGKPYGGRKADPRPTSDRQYLSHTVHDIVSFLHENGYEDDITVKQLSHPTSRDFQNIFRFLVSACAPFEFHRRFDEEVPVTLKFLSYPFSLSKSALSAVGSPHTWPTLLGVLAWLVELLKYGNATVAKAQQPSDDKQSELHAIFREDLIKSYDDFLNGGQYNEELNAALDDKFRERSAAICQENDEMVAAKKQLEAGLADLRNNPSPLEQTTGHRQTLESNIKKFKMLIPSMLEHQKAVMNGLNKRNEDVEKLADELEQLSLKKKQAIEIIDSQKEQSIDASDIARERAELRKELERCAEGKRREWNEFQLMEESVQRLKSEIELHRKAQHGFAAGLSKNSRELLVRVNLVTEGEDVLSHDELQKTVNALREWRSVTEKEENDLQISVLKREDAMDIKEDGFRVVQEQLEDLKRTRMRFEREFEDGKQRLAQDRKKRTEEIAGREQQVAEDRKVITNRIKENERRVQVFEVQKVNMERQFEEKRTAVAKLLLEDVKFVQGCKRRIHDLIGDVVSTTGESEAERVTVASGLPPTIPRPGSSAR